KVAYDGYSMTTAPMNYAVQKGIFKKYGLDVTLAYIDAGTTLSQAVVGGSTNIAQNGYSPAAAAAVQGAEVAFTAGISHQLPHRRARGERLSRAGRLPEDRRRLSQHLLCFDARLREQESRHREALHHGDFGRHPRLQDPPRRGAQKRRGFFEIQAGSGARCGL